MKRNIYLYMFAAWTLLCSACTTLNTVSLEMLTPSELSFPPSIRTIAVVDNVAFSDTLLTDGITLGDIEGDGRVMAEQLAQRLSDSEYFNEVLLCDSSLRRGVNQTHSPVLTMQQVNNLSADLGADMLVVVDGLGTTTKVSSMVADDLTEHIPLLDGAISARMSLYVPGRTSPLHGNLSVQDTLQWYLIGGLNERQIVERVAERAAELSMKYLVPVWHPVERFYYVGSSVAMRDAAVSVKENQWEEAGRLWKSAYDSSKSGSTQRMQSALNLALYQEVQGNMSEAMKYGEEALQLAKPGSTNYQLIEYYQLHVLTPKVMQMQKLGLQMERFNEK